MNNDHQSRAQDLEARIVQDSHCAITIITICHGSLGMQYYSPRTKHVDLVQSLM